MSSPWKTVTIAALAVPPAFFCAQGAVARVEYYRRGALVWMAALIAAAALHALWITLLRGSSSIVATAACWLLCAALAGAGLKEWHIDAPGWLLEGLAAIAALAAGPPVDVADRLARWREIRAGIAAQLEMSEGLLPWLRRCLGQAWRGDARSPIEAAQSTVQAALRHAVRTAECRAAERIHEEEVRQLVLTALESVGHKSALTFARAALECEREALSAAAQLRSAIGRTSLDPGARERLAQTCETLLLSLTLPERGRHEEPVR